jgi:hypothetical protein
MLINTSLNINEQLTVNAPLEARLSKPAAN